MVFVVHPIDSVLDILCSFVFGAKEIDVNIIAVFIYNDLQISFTIDGGRVCWACKIGFDSKAGMSCLVHYFVLFCVCV